MCVVDDALFEQRGADAHDHRAVDLALGQPRVDDHAAILHRHVAVHLHNAGLGVDRNVRDLHSAGAACVQPGSAVAAVDVPISEILFVPSFRQAAAQVMLLAGVPFTRMLPSTASSWSGSRRASAPTVSNSFASAFTVDLRVEVETPPTVVEPPDPPSGGR